MGSVFIVRGDSTAVLRAAGWQAVTRMAPKIAKTSQVITFSIFGFKKTVLIPRTEVYEKLSSSFRKLSLGAIISSD